MQCKIVNGKDRYYSSISLACDKAEATRPAGTETIPNPITSTRNVKHLPPTVTGYTSPYPTVVNVATALQSEWDTDANVSG